MELLTKNIKYILLVLALLVVSNIITSWNTSRLSKKEMERFQKAYDSLAAVVNEQNEKILVEQTLRRKIFSKDSLLEIEYKKKIGRDSILLIQQSKALSKYKHLTASQALTKLDSAYEADIAR